MSTLNLQQGVSRTFSGNGIAGNFTKIPIIDLAPLTCPNPSANDHERLVSVIRDACQTAGFFIIKNHGIDWRIVENAFDGLEEFFSLPLEEKMMIHQDQSPSYMGYEQMFYTNVDGLKRGDKKEAVSVAYNPAIDPKGVAEATIPEPLRRENCWPVRSVCPKFQTSIEAYQMACLSLIRKLIRVMSTALGLEESFFDKKMTYPIASVRCLYYPPQEPEEENETGLGAHTDIQMMTLIAQRPYDQPALEVLNAAGEWVRPQITEPECFVVNLSDMMARLTNDVFQSTIHRVRNNDKKAQQRYSLPFFFGLNQDELTTTLPQFVTKENPLKPHYEKGMTGYEHYSNRLRKAHTKHPSAKKDAANLPPSMIRVDGVLLRDVN